MLRRDGLVPLLVSGRVLPAAGVDPGLVLTVITVPLSVP
jgi:hypothetical protein